MRMRHGAVVAGFALGLMSGAANASLIPIASFGYTGTIFSYTLDAGSYKFIATGASGGSTSRTGGLGGVVTGTFNFSDPSGTTIRVLVGQQGQGGFDSAGGGGGTFITTASNIPLLIAGGGGGASSSTGNGGQAGGNARDVTVFSGRGGAAGVSNSPFGSAGGGGGGFQSNGGSAGNSPDIGGFGGDLGGSGGFAFVAGGRGGFGAAFDTDGGFGGGGGGASQGGGGGGGGNNGGDGGSVIEQETQARMALAGLGGSSLNIGADPTFSLASDYGNGSFVIDRIVIEPPSTVPLPASAPMFGAALLALGAVGYGLKHKKAAAAA